MIDNYEFYETAIGLIEAAEKENITMRLIGSTAIMHHAHEKKDLFKLMDRKLTDIDLMAYGRQRAEIIAFLEKMGYKSSHNFLGSDRLIYEDDLLHIDVFFNNLSFCHPISFKGRLELDFPTIPLSDLLLEKMQIVKINHKDLVDSTIMIMEHDVGFGIKDPEIIDLQRIIDILKKDWGFYYTFTENLKKVLYFSKSYKNTVKEQDLLLLEKRIINILSELEASNKSFFWKIRAMVGTRIKWYQEVEDVLREVG